MKLLKALGRWAVTVLLVLTLPFWIFPVLVGVGILVCVVMFHFTLWGDTE